MRIPFFGKETQKSRFTIAFYNVENLFDPVRDMKILDEDFTPVGVKKWTHDRYVRKLQKIAKTIVNIGVEDNPYPPILVGLAEVENRGVLNDLMTTSPMDDVAYDIVHFDSPDERGIDTALIYHKKYFKVEKSEAITLYVEEIDGGRDTTRDILYVKGKFNGENVHVFVNHWPSRRGGDVASNFKRVTAAKLLNERIKAIHEMEEHPNIIVMGDFNDDPSSESVQTILDDKVMFNAMTTLHEPKRRGTSTFKGHWHLFDQIMVSNSFLNFEKGTHSFDKAEIYDHPSLMESKGKFKGAPYRTFIGNRYMGGYSDHFPVYAIFSYNS